MPSWVYTVVYFVDELCQVADVEARQRLRSAQRRSWPGGSRGPDPPELPSGVHQKSGDNFLCRGGSRGLGSR